MKHILALLSVVAVIASLQVIGGDKKSDCALQCDKAKTQVGAVAASEGTACEKSKIAVGAEAKSDCGSCEKTKTAVGTEAKAECAATAAKTAVGSEAKAECAATAAKTAVGSEAKAADCSACEKSKTAVGEEAKAECASAKTLTYKVGGTDCEESCGNLVKTLTSLDGVSKAEACSKTHLTKISYDASKVKSCDIAAAIKKAGYKVEGQQVSLPVEGMACGACSSKVGKVLTSLDGVINGSACHESKKATVLFNPEKLDATKIVAAINTTGFKAAIAE
ncbi:MAG: metal-transporting ATPase [Verrucomicrobia bacterium]|jgi:copper ion binding protein|nr:metal-transporting ATPase [Verrucomicrobiota bacterium]